MTSSSVGEREEGRDGEKEGENTATDKQQTKGDCNVLGEDEDEDKGCEYDDMIRGSSM